MIAEDLPEEIALHEYSLNLKHQYSDFMALICVSIPMRIAFMRHSLDVLKLINEGKC